MSLWKQLFVWPINADVIIYYMPLMKVYFRKKKGFCFLKKIFYLLIIVLRENLVTRFFIKLTDC